MLWDLQIYKHPLRALKFSKARFPFLLESGATRINPFLIYFSITSQLFIPPKRDLWVLQMGYRVTSSTTQVSHEIDSGSPTGWHFRGATRFLIE